VIQRRKVTSIADKKMACVGEHRLTIWATKQEIKEIKIMTEILLPI
jgi:hypothetical protein